MMVHLLPPTTPPPPTPADLHLIRNRCKMMYTILDVVLPNIECTYIIQTTILFRVEIYEITYTCYRQ